MNIAVSEAKGARINETALREFAASILSAEGVRDDASLSISFVDSAEIADLNERFLGNQRPTDVLSFPIEDAAPGVPPSSPVYGPPLELGDIFICATVVADHAESLGVAFEDELYLMVAHGVLHILGWDHENGVDAQMMETREAKHLKTIGRTRR
ncbi:MAG: rRNA maturation RNase YbeY [Acidimicrobiia bacterium]